MNIVTTTRYACYAALPLLALLLAASLACLISYAAVQVWPALPLRTLVSKTTLVLLILGIFPATAYLNMSHRELGFADRPLFFQQLLRGFGLGVITLLPVFIVLYLLGVSVIDSHTHWTLPKLAEKTVLPLLLAVLIAALEEPLFRGLTLMGLRRVLPTAAALVISAGYYAALHFLTTKTNIPASDIDFFSAFRLLGAAFANLSNPDIWPALSALWMVGIFLGLLRTRIADSMGLCIGCHAAWVWLIKVNKALFDTDYQSAYAYLVSRYDGVIGPLVTAWLALAIAGYWGYRQFKQPRDI